MESLDKKAKSVKACETCKKPFGLTRIRHTCKRCNKIICADCTKGRIKIVTYDLKAAHKVCLACEKEHHFQVNFKTSNQTSWNTLSKIGQKWLSACDPKSKLTQSQEGYEESYRGYLEIVKNPYFSNQNDYFNMIDRDIAQGRLDRERTNYSFQEFLFHNQGKLNQEQIRASLGNVLKAFVVKFPEIGYCPNMNYVAMFLLCLMDEESAFWMMGYVVANLLPANFYGQTDLGMPLIGFQQEKFVMSNLIKEYLGLEAETAHKITTLLDVHGASLIAPLLANFTNFEVLFETWNKMLTNKTLNEVRKITIHMMKLFFPKLKDKTVINPVEFQVMVIRLFGSEEFKDAQNIQIDDQHVKFLEAKFRGDHSNQWQGQEIKMHHALRKVTQIKKSQIKLLKEQFNKLFGSKLKRSASSKVNQSATEEAEGLAKDDFKKLLNEVLANDPTLMEGVDVDQLYDSFDSDKSGLIDFREFLFLVSMVIKGSFEEKIQSAFYVFDSGDKGVLTSNEFDQFLQILIQTTVQANQNNITPFFNQDLEKFNEKMTFLTNDKEKITFDMIKKDLFNSNFIKYSATIEQMGKQSDSIVKPNIQKGMVADTSVLHTNQTYMDSTQDTSQLTHQIPTKAEDLTRILDHSHEQSTIYEESKYEDEKPNDELLTEEQKLEVLRSPRKEREVGVIGEVEHTSTESTKSLIDRFNKQNSRTAKSPEKVYENSRSPHKAKMQAPKVEADSDSDSEQMRNLMDKWKGSPNKTSSDPKETLFDNPLTGFDSLTSLDSNDQKPELIFNFGEDKQANLHSFANISRVASIPFAKNHLSPLSLSEVDIKPADISDFTLSFFNNVSESRPERHASASFSPQIKKPIHSETYEALALEAPSLKVTFGGWKEGCFESNQILLPVAQTLNPSMAIPKPFLDNSVLSFVPEQEPAEPPGLQMWKLDQFEQVDKALPVAQPATIMRPINKPIAEENCYSLFGSKALEAPSLETFAFARVDAPIQADKAPMEFKTIQKPIRRIGQYNSLCSQSIVERPVLDITEGKLFEAFDTCQVINMTPAKTSATVKKPFYDQGMLMPLAPSEPEEYISLLEWKEGCFGAVGEEVSKMETLKTMAHIRNPFAGGSHEGFQSEERQFEVPFVGEWKEDCFESFEKKILESERVKILEPVKKPFEDEGCAPMPADERFFDEPRLGGWKENCFVAIERPASLFQSNEMFESIGSPFTEDSCEPLGTYDRGFDRPALGGWKEGCFQSVDTPAMHVNVVHSLSNVNKPFAGLACEALPPQGKHVESSSWFGDWKEDGFRSAEMLLAPAKAAQVNMFVRKPIEGGQCEPLLPQQASGDLSLLQNYKEDFFSSNDLQVVPMKSASSLTACRKPITEESSPGLRTQTLEVTVALGWKESCFVASEIALESTKAVSHCKSICKPFIGGHSASLPSQQVCTGSSLLQGCREDLFVSNQTQLIPLESVLPSDVYKKPISGGVAQNLVNQAPDTDISLHWKEHCFVSSEVALVAAKSVIRCSTITKPFDDAVLLPLPTQEQSEIVSLLAGWKEDWAHATEKSLTQASVQMKTEMLSGEVTSSLPLLDRQFSSVNMQAWGEENFRSNQVNIAPMGVAQHIQVHEKPFCLAEPCRALPKHDEYLRDSNRVIWKQDCFISFEAIMPPMDIVESLEQIEKPFEENCCEPVQPLEREFDQINLSGWAKDCFESADVAIVLDRTLLENNRTRNPFTGGKCETVPADRRPFDDSITGKWKANCFDLEDQRLTPSERSRPMKKARPSKKIIKIEGVRANQGSRSETRYVLTTGKWDIFISVNKETQPMENVIRCQPAPKPVHTLGTTLPFAQDTREQPYTLGEAEMFRSINQRSLPHSKVIVPRNAFLADKNAYKNVAEQLLPDEADTKTIFISDYTEKLFTASQVQAQTPATINKNAEKVLYGSQLTSQTYTSSEYYFLNNTDNALRPHTKQISSRAFSKSGKSVRRDMEERKLDESESGGTIVVENSASGSAEHEIKSDDFEVVKDSPGREHMIVQDRAHNDEREVKSGQKGLYIEEEDDETLEDSTFLNRSALKKNGGNLDISVMTSINESGGDDKVWEKRKVDSAKLAGEKGENCKVCNLF